MKRDFKIQALLLLLASVCGAQALAEEVPAIETLDGVAPTAVVANCGPAAFVPGGVNTNIAIAGTSYTPRCLKIKVGSQVTIEASSHHPLAAMPEVVGVVNPFANASRFVSSQTRVFNQPGVYGYYCTAHGDNEGDGMAGAILVEP